MPAFRSTPPRRRRCARTDCDGAHINNLVLAALIAPLHPLHAEVPVAIAPSGHATVPVRGDFGELQFVFDTGAEGSAVYENVADEHQLPLIGMERLQGQTGASELPLVQLGSITVDGVPKGPIAAVRLPRRADGVPLAGIIGLDVFGDRMIDFDLPGKTLTLRDSGSGPGGLRSTPLHASVTAGNLLTVEVEIGKVTATAVIDTGARKTRFNWRLGRLLGLDPAALPHGETIHGATNVPVHTSIARVPEVRIGGWRLADAPALVADVPVFATFGLADKPAVILGLDWLESTRLVVDFPARRVWFEQS
jgi:predicted aspartyl protease